MPRVASAKGFRPIAHLLVRDTVGLAPALAESVESALEEANGTLELGVAIAETWRHPFVQETYWYRGRTDDGELVDPRRRVGVVTNARLPIRAWHYFWLALDVVHETFGWFNNAAALDHYGPAKPEAYDRVAWRKDALARAGRAGTLWYAQVAACFKRHHMAWGAEWPGFKDVPHFQWHRLKRSPSDHARELYFGTKHWQGAPLPAPESEAHNAGLRRLWRVVGAF